MPRKILNQNHSQDNPPTSTGEQNANDNNVADPERNLVPAKFMIIDETSYASESDFETTCCRLNNLKETTYGGNPSVFTGNFFQMKPILPDNKIPL
jgi:hypothetical protein